MPSSSAPEHDEPPCPGGFDNEPPDVVATQGAFLKTRPPTPLFCRTSQFDSTFYTQLCGCLRILSDALEYRHRKYGSEVAEEWLMGHTPTEVREKRAAEVQAELDAILDAPTSPDSPSPDHELRRQEHRQQRTTSISRRQPARLVTPSSSDLVREDTPPHNGIGGGFLVRGRINLYTYSATTIFPISPPSPSALVPQPGTSLDRSHVLSIALCTPSQDDGFLR
ncbi:hypothetical protein VTH06DRAFT_2473 [Thermothelomyces fergusii]